MELISSPDTPKSHILISPWELHRILEGLISVNWIDEESRVDGMIHHSKRTAMNDAVYIIKIGKSFEYGKCHFTDNLNVDGSNLLVHAVEGALVHKFHANTNIRVC